jgi:hypothetical protein
MNNGVQLKIEATLDLGEEPILYVSADNPHEADRTAEEEVKAFDPKITIERVKAYTQITTPRLLIGRNYYRGLASIRAFIAQEQQKQTRKRA